MNLLLAILLSWGDPHSPMADRLEKLRRDVIERRDEFRAVDELEGLGPLAPPVLEELEREPAVRSHGWLWCAVTEAGGRIRRDLIERLEREIESASDQDYPEIGPVLRRLAGFGQVALSALHRLLDRKDRGGWSQVVLWTEIRSCIERLEKRRSC